MGVRELRACIPAHRNYQYHNMHNSTKQTKWWNLETNFASLGLEGFRFRSQVYCFETWNTVTIWLSKTSVIQRFLSVVSEGKKQPKQLRKTPEIRKKFQLRSGDDIFLKFSAYSTIFKCRFSVSVCLIKSRSRSFNQVLVSKFRSRPHLCKRMRRHKFSGSIYLCTKPQNLNLESLFSTCTFANIDWADCLFLVNGQNLSLCRLWY